MRPSCSTSKQCSICGSLSHGIHFGAVSCRACAAFFKRSVDMQRTYKCRRSGGKCDLTIDVRCICRACRYAKCLAMGMSLNRITPSLSDGQSPSSSRALTPSPPDPQTGACEFGTISRVARKVAEVHETFVSETPRPQSVTFDLVTFYTNQYFNHVPNLVHDFPFVDEFSADEMAELQRTFAMKFTLFDSACFTGHARIFDKIVFYDGNYIDIMDLEHYFSSFKTAQFTPQDAARIHYPSFLNLVRVLVKPLAHLDLTEIEKAGLLLLIFFEPGIPALTKETDVKVLKGRDLVLRELCNYYRTTQQCANYPLRMAHIMTLIPCVERVIDVFIEDTRINKMFGGFNDKGVMKVAGII